MIENRKEEHINIAENENVTSEHNYWDDIRIIHRALPEINYDEIDTRVRFLNSDFAYPFIISSIQAVLKRQNKREPCKGRRGI